MVKKVLVLFVGILLAGCGKAVPPEKSAYVGQWQSPQMTILITQDGSVSYKRLKKYRKHKRIFSEYPSLSFWSRWPVLTLHSRCPALNCLVVRVV